MNYDDAIIIQHGNHRATFAKFECQFCGCVFMRRDDACENPTTMTWATTCPECDHATSTNALSHGGGDIGANVDSSPKVGGKRKVTMTMEQFADNMNISMPTAYAMSEQADFPLIRVGKKKLVNVALLQDWLNKQTSAGKD